MTPPALLVVASISILTKNVSRRASREPFRNTKNSFTQNVCCASVFTSAPNPGGGENVMATKARKGGRVSHDQSPPRFSRYNPPRYRPCELWEGQRQYFWKGFWVGLSVGMMILGGYIWVKGGGLCQILRGWPRVLGELFPQP